MLAYQLNHKKKLNRDLPLPREKKQVDNKSAETKFR
jgi:hypothetical protein